MSDWTICTLSNLASSRPVLTCLLTSLLSFVSSDWSVSGAMNSDFEPSMALRVSSLLSLTRSYFSWSKRSLKNSGDTSCEACVLILLLSCSVRRFLRSVSLYSKSAWTYSVLIETFSRSSWVILLSTALILLFRSDLISSSCKTVGVSTYELCSLSALAIWPSTWERICSV